MVYTRYYEVAGMTMRFDSELPIRDDTFAEKFRLFEVGGPGADNVHLVHRFAGKWGRTNITHSNIIKYIIK